MLFVDICLCKVLWGQLSSSSVMLLYVSKGLHSTCVGAQPLPGAEAVFSIDLRLSGGCLQPSLFAVFCVNYQCFSGNGSSPTSLLHPGSSRQNLPFGGGEDSAPVSFPSPPPSVLSQLLQFLPGRAPSCPLPLAQMPAPFMKLQAEQQSCVCCFLIYSCVGCLAGSSGSSRGCCSHLLVPALKNPSVSPLEQSPPGTWLDTSLYQYRPGSSSDADPGEPL